MTKTLFSPLTIGPLNLKNRIVMAPMTRCRAIDNMPNQIMADYYGERASAGLIITEGVAPSVNGCGYARIPGLWNQPQIEAWKVVTNAVHEKGGLIFSQIMHTGRASHSGNMVENAKIIAPSAVTLSGEIYTDSEGMKAYPVPTEMTLKDIEQTIEEFVSAAKNAIEAGFDGVEIHGANGYLIDQFLNEVSNKRTDIYGGSIENRNRFALEIITRTVKAIGADRTGFRISPFGAFNDMGVSDDMEAQFDLLSKEVNKMKLAYIHIVDHEAMGAPAIPNSIKEIIRHNFKGVYMLSGGYTSERAEKDLNSNLGELVAFGRPYIANPNLAERMEKNVALSDADFDTFYTPGEKGYLGY